MEVVAVFTSCRKPPRHYPFIMLNEKCERGFNIVLHIDLNVYIDIAMTLMNTVHTNKVEPYFP